MPEVNGCYHPFNDCRGMIGSCSEKLCPRVNLFPFEKAYWKQNKDDCKFLVGCVQSDHKDVIEK